MIQAILMERIGFIELLLMNGFVMKTFLTVEKLAVLYNEQVSSSISRIFMSRRVVKNFGGAISSSCFSITLFLIQDILEIKVFAYQAKKTFLRAHLGMPSDKRAPCIWASFQIIPNPTNEVIKKLFFFTKTSFQSTKAPG